MSTQHDSRQVIPTRTSSPPRRSWRAPRGSLRDASRVREHLLMLHELYGANDHQIAVESGLTHRTVELIRTGQTRRVRADTERRLLATEARPQTSTSWVDAVATQGLLRWLIDQGATQRWLNTQLGRRLGLARLLQQRWVTRRTAADIAGIARAVGRGDIHPHGLAAAREVALRRARAREAQRRCRDVRRAS